MRAGWRLAGEPSTNVKGHLEWQPARSKASSVWGAAAGQLTLATSPTCLILYSKGSTKDCRASNSCCESLWCACRYMDGENTEGAKFCETQPVFMSYNPDVSRTQSVLCTVHCSAVGGWPQQLH